MGPLLKFLCHVFFPLLFDANTLRECHARYATLMAHWRSVRTVSCPCVYYRLEAILLSACFMRIHLFCNLFVLYVVGVFTGTRELRRCVLLKHPTDCTQSAPSHTLSLSLSLSLFSLTLSRFREYVYFPFCSLFVVCLHLSVSLSLSLSLSLFSLTLSRFREYVYFPFCSLSLLPVSIFLSSSLSLSLSLFTHSI